MLRHRIVYVMCLLLANGYLFAQQSREQSLWDRFFDFLSASKADSAYAVRHPYRFSIKPKLGTSIGICDVSWKGDGTSNRYSLRAHPIWKLGVNVSYRNLTIGIQRNISKFFDDGGSNNTEYSASSYGNKFGGEFSYSLMGRYTLWNANDREWHKRLSSIQSKRLFANGYYVFNHRHFSYPAAFTQSYHQKRSCGSALIGLFFSNEWIDIDTSLLQEEAGEQLGDVRYPQQITSRSFGINGGYAYNWVLGSKWMLHGSLVPSISLHKKGTITFDETKQKLKQEPIDLGCIVRMGALWDRSHYFAGFTAVLTLTELGKGLVNVTDCYVRTRLFYGFRF